MSKFTKLVNSPDIFFKDFLIKRVDALGMKKEGDSEPKKIKLTNKVEVKKKIIDFDFNAILFNIKINTIIHCGEVATVGFNIISQWLPYLEDYKDSLVILVRNYDLFNKLKSEYKNFNIAYAKSPIDVENLLEKLKKLKNICFVSNTANNIHLIRFNEYHHIFIGHFDEGRQPSMHKYFRSYDECWFYSLSRYNTFNENVSSNHLNTKVVNHPYGILKEIEGIKNITYWVVGYNEKSNNSIFYLKYLSNLSFFNKKYLNIYSAESVNSVVGRFLDRYQIASFDDPLLLKMSHVIIMDYDFNQTKEALKLGIPVIIYMPEGYRDLYSDLDYDILRLCYSFSNMDNLNEQLNNLILKDDLKNIRFDFIEKNYGHVLLENHNFKQTLDQLFLDVK